MKNSEFSYSAASQTEGGVFRRLLTVSDTDTDCFDRLRPSTLLRLFQDAGSDHAEVMGIGRGLTYEKGALWIIVRTVLDCTRLPRGGEEGVLSTWPGKTKKVFMPRSFALSTPAGEILARAKSVYLLMDAESRKMLNPESVGVSAPGVVLPDELPEPPSRIVFPAELPETERRAPRYSELDRNGHLNNCRYLDWAEDLLSTEYHRSHALRSLWVEYRMEVRPDDELTLRCVREDDTLYLRGESARGNHFSLSVTYSES